jgi:hypothetical protein
VHAGLKSGLGLRAQEISIGRRRIPWNYATLREGDDSHASAKAMHATIRRNFSGAADVMPVDVFGFRPTPDVRSFAQPVGHVKVPASTVRSNAPKRQ